MGVVSYLPLPFLAHLLLELDNRASQLPAFALFWRTSLELDSHVTQKLVDLQKQSMNRNHGQRHINITRNVIGQKRGQKDCRKF